MFSLLAKWDHWILKSHLLVVPRDLHLLEGPLDANVWDVREEIAAGHYAG